MRLEIAGFDAAAAHPEAVHHRWPDPPAETLAAMPGVPLRQTPGDMLELQDALLFDRGGIVWRGLWIEGGAVHYYPARWWQESWRPGERSADGATVEIEDERLRPQCTLPGPVMLCDSGVAAGNFGHFVHDLLPYGLTFRQLRAHVPEVVPVLHAMRWDSQRRLLRAVFGLDGFAERRDPTLVGRLFVPRRQSVLEGAQWSTNIAGLRFAREAALASLGLPAPGAAPTRVLLHRGEASAGGPAGREFRNVDAMVALLLRHGFVALEPGRVDVRTAAALLASATAVVGVHGANLGNILFCAPGTQVIELRPRTGVWADYQAVAAVLGLRFAALEQGETVDLAGLERVLEAS